MKNTTTAKALLRSKMERSNVAFKNFHLVSYKRFDSCEDKDGMDEDNLANQNIRIIRSVDGAPVSRYYRLAAVCLTLLCVLLIFAVSVLWFKFNNLTTKNTDLQNHYSNLILEKEKLQTSYENLTHQSNQLYMKFHEMNRDKDKLQISNNSLTFERDQLQANYKNLTVKRDQLQTSYDKLNVERDLLRSSYNNLTFERDLLRSSYNNLTFERDLLRSSYNNLTFQRNLLQTIENNLTFERDRLQSSYNNLTIEKDRLQSSYNNLTAEKDRLQTSYNNLTIVRAQDQVQCTKLANEMEKLQTNYRNMANQKDQLQKEKEEQNNCDKIVEQAKLGWVYFSPNFYFISTEKKSWTDSRLECKKKKADLVMIKTKEEQDFLVEQLGSDKAWIGLHDRNTEGLWKWVDGTEVTTAYWAPGEPNNVNNEDCAELWGFPENHDWNDRPCNQKVRWICKKSIPTFQW